MILSSANVKCVAGRKDLYVCILDRRKDLVVENVVDGYWIAFANGKTSFMPFGNHLRL